MEIERNLDAYASMTRWFSPHLLVLAAYRDVVARIFGEFADQRAIQHVADPIPADPELRKKFVHRYDYSGEAQGGAPYWVDFAADLGDGFDSTYAVAYLLAADKLHGEQGKTVGGIQGIRGLQGDAALDHGRVLLFCGDEVYPWPTHEAYELKTFKPYALALPEPPVDPQTRRAPPASRHVYAVPGNHDWYDGLNAFDDQFCRARAAGTGSAAGMRFGDWETRQHRSSFAIKLPHNWWIWGADIQLNDLLDPGQLGYFRAVAEQMGPQDRFILCTAEPSWYALGTPEERFARQNLNGLIEAPIRRGAKLCGIFSGDWHHYSRYNEKAALGNMNLITAGGGGAYIHGTYHLKRKLDFEWIGKELEFRLDRKLEPSRSPSEPEPKETNSSACYPSKGTSYRLALGNWMFPWRNVGFCLAVGLIYWLMTWTFATLRVDFWLDVPKDAKITRGLIQTPRALRECLDPSPQAEQATPQQKARRSIVPPAKDAKECLLATGSPRPDGSRRFEGTGKIEEWTLQLIEFYLAAPSWANTGFLFLKGVHLLLLGLINSVSASIFLFGIWFAFFAITQSKYRGKRGLISRMVVATLHHGTHLLFMWALYCVFVSLNDRYTEDGLVALARYVDASRFSWLSGVSADGSQTLLFAPIPFWVSFVYPFEMVLIGGTLGALIFGLYLMLTYVLGKVNCDWIFSSQRIAGYRCFLRMKFEPDKLTIYPIRLDSVPDRSGWRWRRNPGPREPLVEPTSPLKPRLIEGPIVIRPDEVRNIPRA
jgi:hypothetical protein